MKLAFQRRVFAALFGAIFLIVAAGCATPQTIDGRRVIGTRWVNGRIVYVLEGDEEALRRGANEATEASEGIVFAPLAPEPTKNPKSP
ncbi:MAG TPA: hypothetical protein VNR00_08745 [Opitutus sp.]|nr:hypothetical protein [Opitutus sp.]